MTPEQISNAEREIRKWFPAHTGPEIPIWRRALDMLVSVAKSAIPSGRMAEDYEHLHKVLRRPDTGSGDREGCPPDCIACGWHLRLKRLVAQAQSAEAWRKRMEAAADALAEALPGEVGRLDLVARIAELRRQRDARERDLMVHFEAKNEALNNLVQEREWRQKAEALANENADKANAAITRAEELERCREALADALNRQGLELAAAEERLRVLRDAAANAEEARLQKERADRLSVAGQALSEHVDKTASRQELPGWTMRDEFAKAAMQTFLGDRWRNATEATMLEYAQRAYRMADAMGAARQPTMAPELPRVCGICKGTGRSISVDRWPNPTTSKEVPCWCQEEEETT